MLRGSAVGLHACPRQYIVNFSSDHVPAPGDTMSVRYELSDGLAIITLDRPE